MLLTTTNSLEGTKITVYPGVVTGTVIMGAKIFKDIVAGFSHIIGSRAGAYEGELRKTKDIALREMEEEARRPGGNTVIAVDPDYETIGSGSGNMLLVSASEPSVKTE